MRKVVLNIKDESKISSLLEVLESMDFVEISKNPVTGANKKNNLFFKAAGIWKDHSLDSSELRKQAWQNDNL